jgi:spore coat polysaccharide biosynthesis protein SpsF (cytidylyltransferase family)
MKNVSIKKIKEQLEAGMSREDITKELELNPREAKVLWQHPDLKGIKKAKYKVELNFVEDEPVVETLNAPVQQKSIDFEL